MQQDSTKKGIATAAPDHKHLAMHPATHDGHDMDRDVMLRPRIANMPHQHAMTLVRHETVVAVHMTQFYMEEHKYQLVFEVSFPAAVARVLGRERRRNPKDWFVLLNDAGDVFTVPQLASGGKRSYGAQIFQGLPPFTDKDEENPLFYPLEQ